MTKLVYGTAILFIGFQSTVQRNLKKVVMTVHVHFNQFIYNSTVHILSDVNISVIEA